MTTEVDLSASPGLKRAIADMKSGKRLTKIPLPSHWHELREKGIAVIRMDQDNGWTLVPIAESLTARERARVAWTRTEPTAPTVPTAPTAELPPTHAATPPPAPQQAQQATQATQAKADPPKVKAKAGKATKAAVQPAKLAPVASAPAPVAPVIPAKLEPSKATATPSAGRKLDPRLPPAGVRNTYTAKDGTVYTWTIISDTGRVLLDGGGIHEEFSSVSSAAQRINHNISTNGYLFFGLGKKA